LITIFNIWNATSGALEDSAFAAHDDYILSICYSCDGQYIISGSNDCMIKVWSVSPIMELRNINEHSSIIHSLCCSSDNKYFASASFDKTIKLWDNKYNELVKTFICDRIPYGMCFSPDNKYIISGGRYGSINIWDIATGELVNKLGEDTESTISIACFIDRDISLEQRLIESLKEN